MLLTKPATLWRAELCHLLVHPSYRPFLAVLVESHATEQTPEVTDCSVHAQSIGGQKGGGGVVRRGGGTCRRGISVGWCEGVGAPVGEDLSTTAGGSRSRSCSKVGERQELIAGGPLGWVHAQTFLQQ